MSKIRPIAPEPYEDWYGAIVSTQADGAGLGKFDRDKFNRAFESFSAGAYGNAYDGFVELSKGGSSISQYYLGLMYLNGKGVLQDFRQAHMWLNLASSQDHNKARTQLEKLTQKMTADQLAEAQKLARQRLAKINKKGKPPALD